MNLSLKLIATSASLILLSACSGTPTVTADAPVVYLNSNIGFSDSVAAYQQSEFICDVDAELIEQITDKAARENIRVVSLSTAVEMEDTANLLAIDISKLMAGASSSHSGSSTVSPEVGIEAIFMDRSASNKGAIAPRYEDHCSAPLNYSSAGSGRSGYSGRTAGSSMGNFSGGMCSGIRKCAKTISGDLIGWLAPQVK